MVELSGLKSVVAQGHSSDTSNKFTFIPTTRVVDIMEKQGWYPSKATERNTRKPEKMGFQAHVVRFRRHEDISQVAVVGEYVPEVVVKNSHDGLSSFQIMAGLFRFVCKNGMVVADSMFETYKIRHLGFQDQNVIDAVFKVVETTPKILSRVIDYKNVILSKDEQKAFGESALIAKYGADKVLAENFNMDALVTPMRRQDRYEGSEIINSLWNTMNVVQEKLVDNGGKFGVKTDTFGRRQSFIKVRAVKSVSENIRINQAIWNLTEKMAELKG